MSALRLRWKSFWFEPTASDNLAICRIIFFGSLFLFYWRRDFSAWATVSPVFWSPTWLFRVLELPVLPMPVLVVLQGIWKFALALSCIGLFTRFSTAISFFLGTYLLGLPQNFGAIEHYDAILVFLFLIMALSRCGDSWSFDRLINTVRLGTESPRTRPSLSAEYTWPVRTAWLMMALVFFAAGVAKLRHSGFGWVSHDLLSFWLVMSQYHVSNAEPLVSWGPYLTHYPWLVRSLAASSLMLELGYPLALFSRRARWIFVPGVILMQFGIRMILGPSFGQMVICNVFWVPWDSVLDWVTRRTSTKNKTALLFDGDCGLCQTTVAVVKSLDALNRVELCNVVRQWPEIHRKFPLLSQDECLDEMKVITRKGQVHGGFGAYRALAWVLPLAWPLLFGLYLPGMHWIGSRFYRSISSGRSRGTCPLPRRGLIP